MPSLKQHVLRHLLQRAALAVFGGKGPPPFGKKLLGVLSGKQSKMGIKSACLDFTAVQNVFRKQRQSQPLASFDTGTAGAI
jgi:hypothetical protein